MAAHVRLINMARLLSLLTILLLPLFGTASPLEKDTNLNLVARDTPSSCKAQLRRHRSVASRDLTPLDDGMERGLGKRTFVKGAQCEVSGMVNRHNTPSYVREFMSLQSCADWCKCVLDRASCKTFGWVENKTIPGLGCCSIYAAGLDRMGFQAGTGDYGSFYERGCYKKTPTSSPPPYMTTKLAPRNSEPTRAPVARQEDATERFWALALAED